VRNDAGEQIALVVLAVDLLIEPAMLASTPKDAVVTVADRPARCCCTRPIPKPLSARTCLRAKRIRPGRQRRLPLDTRTRRRVVPAYLTLPGVEWRVAASMPEALC
jgi:hypothetical protein